MGRGPRGRRCQDCKAEEKDGTYVSKRGLCPDCAHQRWADSLQRMQDDPEGHKRRVAEGIARSLAS